MTLNKSLIFVLLFLFSYSVRAGEAGPSGDRTLEYFLKVNDKDYIVVDSIKKPLADYYKSFRVFRGEPGNMKPLEIKKSRDGKFMIERYRSAGSPTIIELDDGTAIVVPGYGSKNTPFLTRETGDTKEYPIIRLSTDDPILEKIGIPGFVWKKEIKESQQGHHP